MYGTENFDSYENAIKELHDVRTGLQDTNDKLREIANETFCNLYADGELMASYSSGRTCLDEDDIHQIRQEMSGSNQTLKFGNDPMVDKQYQKDLFGDNNVKLEIETDDDMLEALARFYSNYRTGDKMRDDVATSMSSWLLELQELRAMKRHLKDFMDKFSRYKNDTRAWANPKFHGGNKETASYVQGKLASVNAIDSYINDYSLDIYNRDEVE